MERLVTPPKRGTSPTWGPPPPCEQALRKFEKRHFGLPGGVETTIKLCIFFSLVQINAITSIDVLWLTHNRTLDLPESLNHFEKAVENCFFLAVTITLVTAL